MCFAIRKEKRIVWLETFMNVHQADCFLKRDGYVFAESANQHNYSTGFMIHFRKMIRY